MLLCSLHTRLGGLSGGSVSAIGAGITVAPRFTGVPCATSPPHPRKLAQSSHLFLLCKESSGNSIPACPAPPLISEHGTASPRRSRELLGCPRLVTSHCLPYRKAGQRLSRAGIGPQPQYSCGREAAPCRSHLPLEFQAGSVCLG